MNPTSFFSASNKGSQEPLCRLRRILKLQFLTLEVSESSSTRLNSSLTLLTAPMGTEIPWRRLGFLKWIEDGSIVGWINSKTLQSKSPNAMTGLPELLKYLTVQCDQRSYEGEEAYRPLAVNVRITRIGNKRRRRNIDKF